MKNYLLLVFALVFSLSGYTQESYSKMTRQALETMWKSEDSVSDRKAFDLYEKAFKIYPDSIDNLGFYKASVLAGELREYDKAFKYLIPLSKVTDDDTQGWQYIVGEYSESEYKNLLTDPRWADLKEKALVRKKAFYQKLKESENEFFDVEKFVWKDKMKPEQLYESITNSNPYKIKKQNNYSISFFINDSAKTSYFVHLPPKYNPNKKYPMLIFLHGAVKNNGLADFQTEAVLGGWNRFYTKYGDINEVILVFPQGSRQYNWMIPDEGFFMIPKIVKQIKKAIRIDDNKVFVTGHSNGATGSFSYLMKAPTEFAGFYGFNTYPKVFTGGTFIKNSLNRSFINFSTDKDYYYPPLANDSLSKLMTELNADYKDYRYYGFPHWFPQFDESEAAYKILFNDLAQRKRNPFPNKIYWELDDEKYGNMDWIEVIKLDTIKQKATWQKPVNFKINEWLSYNSKDSLVMEKVDKQAFDFPRKSGAITAEYSNNIFNVQTSCIKTFRIFISPKMVNTKHKIRIYVNDKLRFDKVVYFDKTFMQKSFKEKMDREQVWVKYIQIEL